MLVAILMYLLIGALFMGGIFLANPDCIDGLDFLFTESNTVNCFLGMLIYLAVCMIWSICLLMVVIKVITDKIND